MNIHTTLKQFLVSRKMSIQRFADCIGYSRVHMSTIVNGKKTVSKRLSKTIEKKIEELSRPMDFKFIRKFMLENGISYQQFAESIGYSRIHIHDVINGRQKPSKELKIILIDKMIMELEKEAKVIQKRIDKNTK